MAKTLTLSEFENYRDLLSKINKKAADEFRDAIFKANGEFGGVGLGRIPRDNLIEYAYALVNKYGEASAAASCEMYDAIASLSGVNVPPAVPVEPAEYSEVAKTVNGVLKKSNNENMLVNSISRLVKRAGADTMLQNAYRDKDVTTRSGKGSKHKHSGAQVAWVPSGDTCPFCIMLASRGWQQQSQWAANNHAEHIHANCDCVYMVRFDNSGGVAGYDPDKYLDMYRNAEGETRSEKLNSIRRMQYQDPETRAKINAQKREAYAERTGLTSKDISVTKQSAYDSYFEYENAQMMKEYSKTGIMPKDNINGDIVPNEVRERLKAEADFIQNNIENTKINTLYRGMVMNADEVRALTPGDTYSIDSLTSTSTDKKLSSIFSNIENAYAVEDPVPVVMTIQQSGGIYGFRPNKDTPEVVLPKGQNYRITKNYMDEDGVVHLEMYAKKGSNKIESNSLLGKHGNALQKAKEAGSDIEDVTELYRENLKVNRALVSDATQYKAPDGSIYKVNGINVRIDHDDAEKDTAKVLSKALGEKVELCPRVFGNIEKVQTPDYLVGMQNDRWDRKALNGSGKDAMRDAIKRHRGQAEQFVVDVSNWQGDDISVINQTYNIFNSFNTSFVNSVIVTKDGDIVKALKKR